MVPSQGDIGLGGAIGNAVCNQKRESTSVRFTARSLFFQAGQPKTIQMKNSNMTENASTFGSRCAKIDRLQA
jgi:hypothetical protein